MKLTRNRYDEMWKYQMTHPSSSYNYQFNEITGRKKGLMLIKQARNFHC